MYCQVLSRGFFTEMRTFFWRKAAANGQILSGSRKRARQDRRPRPSATPPSVFHLPREERCAYFCDFQLSISPVSYTHLDVYKRQVMFMESFDAIADYVSENADPGDLVLTMGAGDIYKVGELILEK